MPSSARVATPGARKATDRARSLGNRASRALACRSFLDRAVASSFAPAGRQTGPILTKGLARDFQEVVLPRYLVVETGGCQEMAHIVHLEVETVREEFGVAVAVGLVRIRHTRTVVEVAAHPVEVDVAQIRQVVMNLLVNAAEAQDDSDGTITIETKATKAELLHTAHSLDTTRSGDSLTITLPDPLPGLQGEHDAARASRSEAEIQRLWRCQLPVPVDLHPFGELCRVEQALDGLPSGDVNQGTSWGAGDCLGDRKHFLRRDEFVEQLCLPRHGAQTTAYDQAESAFCLPIDFAGFGDQSHIPEWMIP